MYVMLYTDTVPLTMNNQAKQCHFFQIEMLISRAEGNNYSVSIDSLKHSPYSSQNFWYWPSKSSDSSSAI